MEERREIDRKELKGEILLSYFINIRREQRMQAWIWQIHMPPSHEGVVRARSWVPLHLPSGLHVCVRVCVFVWLISIVIWSFLTLHCSVVGNTLACLTHTAPTASRLCVTRRSYQSHAIRMERQKGEGEGRDLVWNIISGLLFPFFFLTLFFHYWLFLSSSFQLLVWAMLPACPVTGQKCVWAVL